MHAETRLSLRITHLSKLKLTVSRWQRQGQPRWGLLPSCPTSPSTSPSTRARRRRSWPPSTEMWTTRRWPIDNNSINNNRNYGAFKALKTIYGSTENSEIIRNKTGRECLKLQNSNEKTNCKLCWLGKGSQPITLTRLLLASETPFTFTLSQVFLAKQSISDKEKYLPLSQVFLKKKKILLFPKVFLTKQNLFLFSKYFWQRKTFYTIPNISSETKYISVPKYFWQSKVSFQPEQFLPSKVLSQDMIVLTRNQI